LLGQIARFTEADAIVVGLVGERRREVREFVERELGEALERSTVVVSSSDESPAMRRRAGLLASEIALDLAREGRDVLFLMDSLSRICAAQREIGLSAGEPPATRGYPPSVWGLLPKLLERAGTLPGAGSVTGIYTVLVEGDDLEEPVADAARSLLDGHIVLSRRIAEAGRFPAIDPLASLSRVMNGVVSAEHQQLAQSARSLLSIFSDAEDLIRIGGYARGSDPRVDQAIGIEPALSAFLVQGHDERASFDDTLAGLRSVLGGQAS
jgi:flagellum-specific ATP synthase